jgi:hypothetical protein
MVEKIKTSGTLVRSLSCLWVMTKVSEIALIFTPPPYAQLVPGKHHLETDV